MKSTAAQRSDIYTKLTMILFGSWWSVIIHTLIFLYFTFIYQDMLFLTTVVSLEAIYIGIFILMAESRQEEAREKKELNMRKTDRRYLKNDVDITKDVMKEIETLKKHNKQTHKDLEEIKKIISKGL